VPRIIGALISANRATLAELQTIYSVEDAYDLLEIVAVDNANQRRMNESAR
jgi:hypothetical protein